jgi:hypothetical protein
VIKAFAHYKECMTFNQYLAWIERTMGELRVQYTDDRTEQMLYEIGFLRAQLADAMSNDSQVSSRFRATVRSIKE